MSRDRFEKWVFASVGIHPDAINTPAVYQPHLQIAASRLNLILGNDTHRDMPLDVLSTLYKADYPLHYLVEVLEEIRGGTKGTNVLEARRRGHASYSIELSARSVRRRKLASMEFKFDLSSPPELTLRVSTRLLEDETLLRLQQQPFGMARAINLLSREFSVDDGRKNLSSTRPFGLSLSVSQTTGFKPRPLG